VIAGDTEALRRETAIAQLELPLFEAAAGDYRDAVAAGFAKEEFTAVSRMLEKRNRKRLFGPTAAASPPS